MSGLILHATEDGQSRIQLRADSHTFRLSLLAMAELFSATKQRISLHLKNIFKEAVRDAFSCRGMFDKRYVNTALFSLVSSTSMEST
jgi:hypothetical protein